MSHEASSRACSPAFPTTASSCWSPTATSCRSTDTRSRRRPLEQFCRLAGRPALTVHQRDPGPGRRVQGRRHAGADRRRRPGPRRQGRGDADRHGAGRDDRAAATSATSTPTTTCPARSTSTARRTPPGCTWPTARTRWSGSPGTPSRSCATAGCSSAAAAAAPRSPTSCSTGFLAEYSGFGTEVIATGNAGEHAMSLDLGLQAAAGRRLRGRAVRVHRPVRAVRRRAASRATRT